MVGPLRVPRGHPWSLLARLLRWLWRRHRRAVLVACAWFAHYLHGVRRVQLHYGRGGNPGSSKTAQKSHRRLKRIVDHCPSLSAVYWPTWYAPTALLQFALLGLKEIRARIMERNPYMREVLSLPDGGKVALDWVKDVRPRSPADAVEAAPICVLLHGAVQDSSSATMTDLGRSLASRGMPVVVMNRRGYGGIDLGDGEAKMSMFGFDDDLDAVLAAAVCRHPGRPVAIIGFSCGSGFAGRYAGSRARLSAWTSRERVDPQRRPQLLCSVAYDPGYNVSPDGAVTKLKPPYSWAVNMGIKYCYAFRHRGKLCAKSESTSNLVKSMLSPASGLQQTYRLARRLSGAVDSSAYLEMQQPCLEEISVPSLMINSRDDPICVWRNVEDFRADIAANPNLVLAELRRGSHGCKFGFWGFHSVTDAMIGEFVIATWQEWCRANCMSDAPAPGLHH